MPQRAEKTPAVLHAGDVASLPHTDLAPDLIGQVTHNHMTQKLDCSGIVEMKGFHPGIL